MTMNDPTQKTFTIRFLDMKPRILLELTNQSEKTLTAIEILTIFLKTETTPDDGRSEAHIKFEAIKSMLPQQTAVPAHRTWIDGKPANDVRDKMARLKVIEGQARPYVLDISWEDGEGKARFQRVPVGH
jgi:hypothetical protein